MTDAPAGPATGLQRIPTADLQQLAQAQVPPALMGRHAIGALPPAFVAVRALALQREAAARGDDAGLAGGVYYIVRAGEVVGSCGFKDAAQDGWVEVGYGIAPAHQRQGLGTQAVAALCQLAFESGRVRCVRACIEPDNAGSIALARRLGFIPGDPVVEEDGTCVVVWNLSHVPG